MKRKKYVELDKRELDKRELDKSVQKSLSTFFEDKDKEEDKNEIEKMKKIEIQEGKKEEEGIVEDKVIEKRLPNQIETDYYEQTRIDICAKILRERFNINPEIIPVRYGSKPPINQKIYGYYMLITVRDRHKDDIVKFIREECNLKVY